MGIKRTSHHGKNQSFDRAKGSSSNRDCSQMKPGDICEKWLYCTGTQYERSYHKQVVESAALKSKGNKAQFEHSEGELATLEEIEVALDANSGETLKRKVTALIASRRESVAQRILDESGAAEQVEVDA